MNEETEKEKKKKGENKIRKWRKRNDKGRNSDNEGNEVITCDKNELKKEGRRGAIKFKGERQTTE